MLPTQPISPQALCLVICIRGYLSIRAVNSLILGLVAESEEVEGEERESALQRGEDRL